MKGKLFMWNWTGGGYNSCRAKNRSEAMEKAKNFAPNTVLKVAEATLREVTSAELMAEDKRWGPYD